MALDVAGHLADELERTLRRLDRDEFMLRIEGLRRAAELVRLLDDTIASAASWGAQR